MKEITYNNDLLKEKDITETTIRTKGLIINNGNLLIGNQNDAFQFLGGHLEENETLINCLKREILEETGIELVDNEIEGPFMKITYMNKDHPEKDRNRKAEIYFYIIKTIKEINLNKVSYTESEKKGNFKIVSIPLKEAINIIEKNSDRNEKSKIVSPDMIMALKEYFVNYDK